MAELIWMTSYLSTNLFSFYEIVLGTSLACLLIWFSTNIILYHKKLSSLMEKIPSWLVMFTVALMGIIFGIINL